MLNKLKTFLWIQKKSFYPLMNTNYRVETLWKTDYLNLYKGWIYLATTTISDSISELDFNTFSWEKEKEHIYKNLIDYDFLKKVSSYMLLNGNCFVYKEMIGNKVDSLAILRPDMVNIESNADGTLRWYRYDSMFFHPDDIINFEMFNPLETRPSKIKWVSPVQAIAIQAEMDNTANRWNWNFFKNGWSVKDIIKSDKEVSKESKERYINKWKKEFQWVNNSHKIAFLDQGLNYESIWWNQKELDFVESRRFTRDEILSVYKIPKSIVWITDNVNLANAKVSENTYFKICIKPLAKQISQTLTKQLFNNEVNFDFINVVPKDTEQLERNLNNWTITINEYRQSIGYTDLKNWDVLKLNEFQIMPSEWEIEVEPKKNQYHDIVKKAVRKYTKWTEEYKIAKQERKEKIWYQKIKRTDKYETKWEREIKKVFQIQKEDTLKKLNKWVNKIRKPDWNKAKYMALWKATLRPLFTELALNEGNEALNIVNSVDMMFEVWNPEMNKYIRDNIERIANDVDETTKDIIFTTIEEWNDEGLGSDAITNNISKKFEDFSKNRAALISRTEITNASNEAAEEAYKQSWVVEKKEFLAELDDRTSDICRALDGKIFYLWETIFKKGETIAGYTNNYMDVQHPALHPYCRSTLIPVID